MSGARGRAVGANHQRAPMTEDVEWQLKGRCSEPGMDREMWFPAKDRHAKDAILICRTCPVVIQCREWALTHREQAGVWGALSEGQREAIWRGRPIQRRYHSKTLQDLGYA